MARDLRSIDPTAKRNLEYQESGSDIACSLPYSIQCKCQKNPNVWKALEEARSAASGRIPLAVVKRTGVATVAVLYWTDFLRMLEEVKT